MREQTCCFTGHRDLSLSEKADIAGKLEQTVRELIQAGVEIFETGGALGFDTLAAETVLKLREEYPHIRLLLVLPCLSQTRRWKEDDVKIYEEIKTAADEVIYTSETYTKDCMHKRNRYMVDHSGVCICYLTQDKGGTAYTVNYAKKQGREVINLAEKDC